MKKINIAIIGASGYTGGELIRLLYSHPNAEIVAITSRQFEGKDVGIVHPNLRGLLDLTFTTMERAIELKPDLFFTCLPHGVSMKLMPQLVETGAKIVDLGADFRLTKELYEQFYGEHSCPELLNKFVYGLPELHREEIKKAHFVASPGCTATATILALAPIAKMNLGKVIVDIKIGSTAAGRNPPLLSVHHSERTNVARTYSPKRHRHMAEIMQEIGLNENVFMTATAVNMIRGILSTVHVMTDLDEKELRKAYREFYGDEHFVRVVAKKSGPYNLPDPKHVLGSNFAEVGFSIDRGRTVILGAIDNEVKGASGQAIQSMNIMFGLDERTGIDLAPIYPI